MKLSSRTRYGLRFLINLGLHYNSGKNIQLREIAEAENLSEKYLEQLILLLKPADIITAVRGSGGGYQLTTPPHEINLLKIVTLLEKKVELVSCNEECGLSATCATKDLWQELNTLCSDFFASKNLGQLVDKSKTLKNHL